MENIFNQYCVYLNGNVLKFSNANKKPCLRYALRLAKNPLNYVELFYVHSDGKMVLCKYWN